MTKKNYLFYLSGKDGTMQTVKFLMIFLLCTSVILMSGCESELANCKLRSKAQLARIDRLDTEKGTAEQRLDKCTRQLGTAENACNIKQEGLQQEIAALEGDLARKKSLIARMQEQLQGGVSLPPELITMLEDFAAKNEMVTYDLDRGIVKFKSDLLFRSGSDEVLAPAAEAVKSLCAILNSEQAKEFDIMIAGHTDDQPIRYSRPKHPTNWHLSAHRAISVLKIMEASKIDLKRLSARGFGEFRPVEPNKPDKKGNPKNRRVEIYIVAKGT
jgi:chemotaxis protein MotB